MLHKYTGYWYLFFGPYPLLLCSFKTNTFRGMALPRPRVKPTLLDPFDRASLYLWTDRGRFHLRMGLEPFLET
jgi:hypothetical protein